MKTTSYTREGDNIVSDEQPEVDIGERQISLERETLNTELQITESVLTALPEKEEKDTESVLHSVPERKEEDIYSVIQTVPERKEEDTCSVLHSVPERKEEDTCSVLHSVPERKEEDTYSVLQAVPERKEEDTYSVLQTVPERKEENTYSVLQTVPERKEEDTCSVIQVVPERKEEDTCSVIQVVPERKEEDTCSVLHSVPERKEEDTCSVLHSVPERKEEDTCSVLQTVPERKEEDTCSVLHSVPERKEEDTCFVLHSVPERKEEDTYSVLQTVPERKEEDKVIQIPADECNLYFSTGMKRERELKEKTDKFADDGLEETIKNVDGAQDGGWGWLIVLSSMLIHFIIGGFDRSGGILYLKFEEKFKTPAAVTAWVPSISSGLRLTLGPVVGVMCHRFSFRSVVIWGGFILVFALIISGFAPNIYFLFVSYGVIGGIGQAMAYSPAVVIVSAYFHKKLGTAIGLGTSGVGLGTFAIPLLLETSFTYYGYLGALIMAAAASLQIIVCGALMRPHDSSKTKTKTKLFDLSLLKDLRYCAFCVAILLFTLAFSSGMVFLPAFALQIGTSEFEAAYTVVVTGVSDGIGRLFAGFLFDRKFMKPYRIYIYNVLIIFMGVVSLTIPSLTTFSQLAVACAIYGSTIGMYVSQKSVIIVDLLGIENLSKSFGIVLFFQGIGVFIGPPLSGLLKDLNGKYDYAFYFGGSAVLLGSCILLVSNIIHFLKSRRVYQM
ncbi:monocarboxylate transporter 9-like [Mytilus californianus]|uniref:monocarboxylate transporter 9-like n=1 Tax=Mytilus californianus TaxID=6549 RepID=UPI0022475E32|nr:monocarboxylate transporter 9-like [Mytilus californianus]